MRAATALILAGSRGPDDPLAAAAGVACKAMIDVGGVPMLARVILALAGAGFSRVAVALQDPEPIERLRADGLLPANVAVEWSPAEAGPSASVETGLARLGTPLLVTTADHALLRPEWVERFLAGVPSGVDAAAAVARSEAVTAAAPDARRTFLRFADGAFSGCNLFYLATPQALRVVSLWREVEGLRKTPIRMLRRLGPATAARYGLGLLSLRQALDRLERLSGAAVAAVELPFGRAAIDVDTFSDLALVRRLVEPQPR
ncbi:MAG TPA: nucleotidyltransferase family protein [Caulobacteraceae bacterium]|nr:nucleotidyltransferase family protein [Caulobacteraceae bacterium]